MASKRLAQSLFVGKGSLLQACRPAVHLEGTLLGNHRTLATETAIPSTTQIIPPPPQEPAPLHYTKPKSVLTTIYKFPTMEPLEFAEYPSEFLDVPLRRDILHRAIVFEGDCHRRGQAHTKWRDEVYGSGRKIRQQKGTGGARLGDKKSPMLVGGGVAHGPKPKDWSSKLPRKMYDLAWRTALSHRYRIGELTLVDEFSLQEPDPALMNTIMIQNGWGHIKKRSLLITADKNEDMVAAMKDLGREGRTLSLEEVDVKDLLELGRIVFEKAAFEKLMEERLMRWL